jgi:hypothetical protein
LADGDFHQQQARVALQYVFATDAAAVATELEGFFWKHEFVRQRAML